MDTTEGPLSTLACRCGTRLKRPGDPAVVRASCPSCGAVIALDALPTLRLDDAAPEFEGVSLDVGRVSSPGGAWISAAVRIEASGRGLILLTTSEDGRRFQTLTLTMDEFALLTQLVQKTNNAINHLHSPGRVRAIFRGTRDG